MTIRSWLLTLLFVTAPFTLVAGYYSWQAFSDYQQDHARQRVDVATYEASTSNKSPEACRAIMTNDGLTGWFGCIVEAATSDGDAKQSEYGLQAQQDIAAWAFGMLIVTVWMAVVTLPGVFFVGWTLFVTRQMAVETRKIGEAQVRAYPSVSAITVNSICNGIPSWNVAVRNSGNSPAIKMKCQGRLMLSYQEDVLPAGTVAQIGMEISVVSGSQASIPSNSEASINVFVPHLDDEKRNIAMKELSSDRPRKNPFWSLNIFFNWFDVFDKEHNFYINAGQFPNIESRKVSVDRSALCEGVLTYPMEITFQTENRQSSDD
jgi:hypothetical protein